MGKKRGNYDLLAGHVRCVPGIGGMFALLGWLLVGALLGNVIVLLFTLLVGSEMAAEYSMLISYPLMFIPPLMYARTKSMMAPIDMTGVALDSNHFGTLGIWACSAMVMVATIAGGFMTDLCTAMLPQMPAWLEEALGNMTQGNIVMDFICVSVLAPLCEEWLCRGMVLRGLLNYEKPDGSKGMAPKWAIVISAAFFAFIHLNPWQAIPAFIIGCLLGYVYYRTGSLKLTMLMHFTNNTFAIVMSRVPQLEDMQTWLDVFSPLQYGVIFAACALIIVLTVRAFNRIPLSSPEGNCDELTDIL